MAKCEQRMREAAYSFVGLPQTAENLNDFHNTMQQIRDQAEMEAAWLGIRYIVHNLLPTGAVGEDQA